MTDRADTHLLLDVMHRHRIGVREVADLSGHHHSYMSRVCSGQHPVPADLLRRLYRRTQDLAIGEYLLGNVIVISDGCLSIAAREASTGASGAFAGGRQAPESELGLLMHSAARLVAAASGLVRVSGLDEMQRLAVRIALAEVISLAMRLSAPGADRAGPQLTRLEVTA